MSKRRQTSSAASRGADGDDSDDAVELSNPGPPPSRKKKKLEPSEICQQLYDTIRSYKKEGGILMCDSFMRALQVIQDRKQELDHDGGPAKMSERIRSKRTSRVGPVPNSRALAIMDPPGSDPEPEVKHTEDNADSDEEKPDNEDSPQWKLLDTVKNHLGPSGRLNPAAVPSPSPSPAPSPTVPKSNLPLKKKLHYVSKQLAEFTCSDGRQPILAFMEKPSKEQYPEYYDVIDRPIDMITIEANIKNDRYGSLEEMVSDFRLMFSNCREFNEEGSMIYEDANLLERVMNEKVKEVNNVIERERKTPVKAIKVSKNRTLTPFEQKLRTLHDALRDDKDPKGRLNPAAVPSPSPSPAPSPTVPKSNLPLKKKLHYVSKQLAEFTCSDGRQPILAFMEKPSKEQYPEYYDVIDRPIDMITIEANIKNDRYGSLEEMVSDFRLMFSNCREFNEEGSMIYEDANLLERVMNEKVKEVNNVTERERKTPVKAIKVGKNRTLTPFEQKRRTLHDALRDDKDPKGRLNPAAVPSPSPSPAPSPTVPKSNLPLKKKLHYVSKQLAEFTCSDGRQPILAFMEKPSKEQYPEYYDVIDRPIDMITIEANIKNDRYGSLEEMVSDFRLMFSNCREFNEEGSMIYEDANLLERVMNEKVKEVNNVTERERKTPVKAIKVSKNRTLTPFEQKLRTLHDALRDDKDPKGRLNPAAVPSPSPSPAPSPTVSKSNLPLKKKLHYVSKQLVEFTCSDGRPPILAFMEKPSKEQYPEYYDVIDRPIDMITIEANIKNDRYGSLEEMVSDFRLMFSNCREFNEEGSMIYEDANLLERVMNEKVKEVNNVTERERKTPVKAIKVGKNRTLTPFEQKRRTLHDALRDHKDPKDPMTAGSVVRNLPRASLEREAQQPTPPAGGGAGRSLSPASPRRRRLLRARRRLTPFEQATAQFVAVEQRRLRMEETREKNLHESTMKKLQLEARKLEMEENRTSVLKSLCDNLANLPYKICKLLMPES